MGFQQKGEKKKPTNHVLALTLTTRLNWKMIVFTYLRHAKTHPTLAILQYKLFIDSDGKALEILHALVGSHDQSPPPLHSLI